MEFLSKDLFNYLQAHTSPETDLLRKLNRDTQAKVLMPRMLSGHYQGRLLAMISSMLQPQTILEIGTYTGYSALCLAEGLPDHGKLFTIDKNEELEAMVKGFIEAAGKQSQIELLIGDALQLIPTLHQVFDLVFIDADKINYLNYYKLVYEKVRKGGIIIADNVLWSGKVLDSGKTDKDTRAIMEFNDFVHQDERVENILLTIRDGLMVIKKK